MKKLKFKFVLFIVVIILLAVAYYGFSKYQKNTVEINNFVFKTEIVKSQADLERGLSGKKNISADQAMLFVLPDKYIQTFWMKDMNFDIDLLWIDGNKVVAYEQNMLAPEENTPINKLVKYRSPQAVDRVLEIKAGSIENLGIKIGDIVNIKY